MYKCFEKLSTFWCIDKAASEDVRLMVGRRLGDEGAGCVGVELGVELAGVNMGTVANECVVAGIARGEDCRRCGECVDHVVMCVVGGKCRRCANKQRVGLACRCKVYRKCADLRGAGTCGN